METDYYKVRIQGEVPEFLGTDLEEYGSYKQGDVAELPEKNAEVLSNRGMAEILDKQVKSDD